jgi:hypothetical protein
MDGSKGVVLSKIGSYRFFGWLVPRNDIDCKFGCTRRSCRRSWPSGSRGHNHRSSLLSVAENLQELIAVTAGLCLCGCRPWSLLPPSPYVQDRAARPTHTLSGGQSATCTALAMFSTWDNLASGSSSMHWVCSLQHPQIHACCQAHRFR